MPPEQIASIQHQLEHIDDNRQAVILGAGWSLWVAAIIAIVLRFYAKSMIRSKFKADDGMILIALVSLHRVRSIRQTNWFDSSLQPDWQSQTPYVNL